MKKFLALLLVTALALGISSSVLAEKKYGFEGYDPGITLTFIKRVDNNLVNLMDATTAVSGETFEDNRYLDLWRDELGITVKYEWIAAGEDATTKRAMAITSGELPDVFFVDKSSAMLADLVENNVIWDMTEIYDEYASDLLKSLISYGGSTAALDSVSVNNRLYAIPNVLPSYDQCEYMWIRQDWLDNLNLSAPTTYEELLKVAEAFTTQDPDGNGINDTWGYSSTLNAGPVYNGMGFNWGCHAYKGSWIELEDGTIGYGSVQPAMLESLKLQRTIIENGWTYPEYATEGCINQFKQGKIGIVFSQASFPVAYSAVYSNIPEDAHMTAFPLISIDGEPVYSVLGVEVFGNANALAVNKKCEHPEAVVLMFNVLAEAMWGENNDYMYYYAGAAPSGNEYNISDVVLLANNFNIIAYNEIWEAVANGTTDQLTGSAASYYDNMLHSNRCWVDYISNEWSGNKVLTEKYDPEHLYFFSAYNGAPTETQMERQSMLNDLENSTFAKILLGELDPDEGFAQFVEEWYRLGGEDITREINEAVGK